MSTSGPTSCWRGGGRSPDLVVSSRATRRAASRRVHASMRSRPASLESRRAPCARDGRSFARTIPPSRRQFAQAGFLPVQSGGRVQREHRLGRGSPDVGPLGGSSVCDHRAFVACDPAAGQAERSFRVHAAGQRGAMRGVSGAKPRREALPSACLPRRPDHGPARARWRAGSAGYKGEATPSPWQFKQPEGGELSTAHQKPKRVERSRHSANTPAITRRT
jgi:hypothetical protein